MFIRYFAVLCLVLFICASVDVRADDDEDRANAAGIIAKLLGSLFAGAAANCLGEAVGKCKQHWKHPKAALKCGRDFLKANRGRCAVGK